jgi:phage terminase large subunit-like protein
MLKHTEIKHLPRKFKEAFCYLYEVYENSRIDLYRLLALPHSVEFHRSTKRLKAVFGGNRSGKTQCCAAEVAMMALGRHFWRETRKPPIQIWVLSKDLDTARTVQRASLLEWIPSKEIVRNVWNNTERMIELRNGSQIHFKSWTLGYASLQGRKLDVVWFDEEPSDKQVIEECMMRLLDRKGTMLISCTPQLGYTILYYMIVRNDSADPEVAYWKFATKFNFYLPKDEIERLENKYKHDRATYLSRLYGEFTLPTGLIYSGCYDPEVHKLSWEKAKEIELRRRNERWRLIRALDPSPATFVCKCYAVAPEGDVYCFREMVWHNEANSKIAGDIKVACFGEHYDYTVCGVHGADKHVMLEFPQQGIPLVGSNEFFDNLSASQYGTELRAGISRVKDWLRGIPINPPIYSKTVQCEHCKYTVTIDVRQPDCPKCGGKIKVEIVEHEVKMKRVYYYPTCELTFEEYQLYRWNEAGNDPIQEHCDALDADRYALSSFPAPEIPPERIPRFSAAALIKRIQERGTHSARTFIGGR